MSLPAYPPCPADHAARVAWLEQVHKLTTVEFDAARARGIAWSWTRLFTFAAFLFGGYEYLDSLTPWIGGLTVAALAAFILSVRRHGRVRERSVTLALTRDVVAEARRRTAGEPILLRSGRRPDDQAFWDDFFDTLSLDAPCFPLSPQETDDLDVFGEPLSLFGLLNRTSSPAGAARLARALTRPLSSTAQISERQEAVHWLAEHGPERLHLMAAAAGLRREQKTCVKFLRTVRDAAPLPSRVHPRLFRAWGLAAPIALLLGTAEAFGWVATGAGWLPLIAVSLLNLVLTQFFMGEVRHRLRPWLDLDGVVDGLHFFCRIAVQALPDHALLGEQRRRLAAAIGPGGLPALERTIPFLYLGLSGLLHTLIDVFVFWDLQVLGLLERAYLSHREQLLGAVTALAECETLAALAAFAAEEPDATWPELLDDECLLKIDQGRHPLIRPAAAVPNTLSLHDDANTWIVTGSNMSGKSTFLRMAAVNVLFAEIGSAVTAAGVRLSPMQILTDLRIRDDLSRSESYFLAEVRQVCRMVDQSAAGRAIFALIDEPFRGTNSEERIAAAGAVTLSLMAGSGLFLVATHDAALTRLADDHRAFNYHFRESFDNDELVFDYRLQPGPAESRNALAVLEGEGYPADLVARAKQIFSDLREGRPPGSSG